MGFYWTTWAVLLGCGVFEITVTGDHTDAAIYLVGAMVLNALHSLIEHYSKR